MPVGYNNIQGLMEKVTENMGLNWPEDTSPKLKSNINSAVLELRAAGVSMPVIYSDIGATAIAIICNDLLNIESGNVKISPAYHYYVPILQAVRDEDLSEITDSRALLL